MGLKNSETQQTQKPPEQLTNYWDYLGNSVQPQIGSGNLNPRIPQDFPINAPLNSALTGAGNYFGDYQNNPFLQGGLNFGMQGLQNLGGGYAPSTPLTAFTNPLLGQASSAYSQLLNRGGDPMDLFRQLGVTGGSDPRGSIYQSGGGASSSYDPMTQGDIDNLIKQTNQDLEKNFEENDLANIRRAAVDGGSLGGSRQGIAEGIAQRELGRAELENASRIRTNENDAERNRLASVSNAVTGAGAQMFSADVSSNANQLSSMLGYLSNLGSQQLGAAQGLGNLTGQGYGQGLDALQSSLGMLPNFLNLPGNWANQAGNFGIGLQGVQQGQNNNLLSAFMNNGSVNARDLQLYGGLFNGAGAGGFGTTTGSNNPSQLGQGLGTALTIASLYNNYNSGGGTGKNAGASASPYVFGGGSANTYNPYAWSGG